MAIETIKYLETVAQNFERMRGIAPAIDEAANLCIQSLENGGKIIFCGNGGSAADSQHLAAELMGRFLFDRAPLAALALTVDTSALTAIGNDYGYEFVFSRQLKGVGKVGDILFGISTSGKSQNIVKAFETAKNMGITTIALTGSKLSKLHALADHAISTPSDSTNHIQEMHIATGHIICGKIETTLCSDK